MTCIDEHVLSNLLADIGNDRDLLQTLLGSYMEEAPQLIAQAKHAREAGDVDVCQRAVHTLKSTSATFGAMPLSAWCKQMEMEARAGKMPPPAEFERLDQLWGEARSELAAAAA